MALALAFALGHGVAVAQEPPPVPDLDVRVNYVYATQFGFGGYSVGGLDVQVYSLPIQLQFDDVVGDWDVRLGLPIIYGHFRFEGSLTGFGTVKATTNSLAFEPRVKLDIPIFEGFRLTPLGALGIGGSFDTDVEFRGENLDEDDFEADDGAFYTYEIGLSSLYSYPWERFLFSFGLAYLYAGDAPFDRLSDGSGSEAYGTLRTGVDVRHPLGFKIGPHITPDAGLFFVYNLFTPSLQFTRVEDAALEVPQTFEFGFSVGSETPMELPVLGNLLDGMRIGAAYDFGEDFDAVHVVFGFPF